MLEAESKNWKCPVLILLLLKSSMLKTINNGHITSQENMLQFTTNNKGLKFVFFVVNTLSFLCFIHIEHVINLLSLSYSSQLCFFNHELWNFRSTFLDLVKFVSVSFLPSGNETGWEVKLLVVVVLHS